MSGERLTDDKVEQMEKKLILLADWFDREQAKGRWGGEKGLTEVQDDLRLYAKALRAERIPCSGG